MKKHRCLKLVLALCVVFWAAGGLAAEEWGETIIPKGSPIKIGLGATLSGAKAPLGNGIKNGAEMAVVEKGQISGHKIVLEARDDGCKEDQSVAIAKKFCRDPLVVGVVGYMCDNGSILASDVHHKHKVMMISPSSTSLELTARGIPVLFRTCRNDKIQGKAAAKFALRRKWIKVAALYDKSAYGQSLADEFKRNITAGGGEVVADEGIMQGEKDFTPVLIEIKSKAPQLIYFGGMAAEASLLVRQMKRIEFKAKFMSDDRCFTERDFIKPAGEAAKGAFVTYVKTPASAAFIEWTKRFEAKYGPRQTFSPQAYDAANILMMAVEKVAEKNKDGSLVIGKKNLRDAISVMQHDGVTGRISFDEFGDRRGSVAVVNKVVCKKGKCSFKELKR